MKFQLKIIILLFFSIILFLLYKLEIYIINYQNSSKCLSLSKEYNKIYSTLYYSAKKGLSLIPSNNQSYVIKNYTIKKINGLCLCTLGKKENLYARGFVEYYKHLGFDKIIIFDNNDIGGESFDQVLKDYIYYEFVEIIDVKGMSSIHIPTFNYCYQKYNKRFDWIAFFDFDEYLFINNSKTINNYIYNENFQKCQTIIFNWYFYDDNDLEIYDDRNIIERFKHMKFQAKTGKSMVRGGIDNLIIPSTHIIGININYFCNCNGNRVFPTTFFDTIIQNNNNAFINHFYTKSAQEFCNKIIKGDAQFHKNQPDYKEIIIGKINLFFTINKITPSKIKILEECLNLDLKNFKQKI